MKDFISITIKVNKRKSNRIVIDSEYDKDLCEGKMYEIGNALTVLNADARITIEWFVANKISGTYMGMCSYYANEAKFFEH